MSLVLISGDRIVYTNQILKSNNVPVIVNVERSSMLDALYAKDRMFTFRIPISIAGTSNELNPSNPKTTRNEKYTLTTSIDIYSYGLVTEHHGLDHSFDMSLDGGIYARSNRLDLERAGMALLMTGLSPEVVFRYAYESMCMPVPSIFFMTTFSGLNQGMIKLEEDITIYNDDSKKDTEEYKAAFSRIAEYRGRVEPLRKLFGIKVLG